MSALDGTYQAATDVVERRYGTNPIAARVLVEDAVNAFLTHLADNVPVEMVDEMSGQVEEERDARHECSSTESARRLITAFCLIATEKAEA